MSSFTFFERLGDLEGEGEDERSDDEADDNNNEQDSSESDEDETDRLLWGFFEIWSGFILATLGGSSCGGLIVSITVWLLHCLCISRRRPPEVRPVLVKHSCSEIVSLLFGKVVSALADGTCDGPD